MKSFIFVSGNQDKADYLSKWLGVSIRHQAVNADEIQSLDIRDITEHKARQAFDAFHEPVLVEDVALTFTAMGRLPGPFIKWFLKELGSEGLCQLASGLAHRRAAASICYAFFDGKRVTFFENTVWGSVAPAPKGVNGFGWNPLFIPEGSTKTYAEMTDDEVRPFSMRAGAIEKLRTFLEIA